MAEVFSLFKTGTKLLNLFYDYNRVPIRLTDSALHILYCSAMSFEIIDLKEAVYQPFFCSKDSFPILHSLNSLELMACFPFEYQKIQYYLVIGPVLLSPSYSEETFQSLRFFPNLEKEELKKLIHCTPVVGIDSFTGLVRLLYTIFTGTEISSMELVERNTGINSFSSISRALSDSVFEQRENATDHTVYAQELFLLNSVKTGDMESLEYLSETILLQNNTRLSGDPLRQAIYQFISSITMVTKTAIEGGLDKELAFNMYEIYIQKADQCKTPLEISLLFYAAVTDFISHIRSIQSKNSYSNHVILCLDYISRHLHESITLDDLSTETGLSSAYLSVLFKKETGLPLSDFIQLQRIEEAKNLLRFSEYRIAEISSYLTFSSQSYFTSVFKRHTGMTPKKYRKTYYRKSW